MKRYKMARRINGPGDYNPIKENSLKKFSSLVDIGVGNNVGINTPSTNYSFVIVRERIALIKAVSRRQRSLSQPSILSRECLFLSVW